MNRKLKFREYNTKLCLMIPQEEMSCHVDFMKYGRVATLKGFLEPPFCEIMQFTGLTDKNGVDIYEGDIVKNIVKETMFGFWYNKYCYKDVIEETKNLVSYNEKWACFNIVKGSRWGILEVIGNIFENPDLLQK